MDFWGSESEKVTGHEVSSLAAETYDYWGDPHEQDAGQIWIPESVVEFLMRVADWCRLLGVVVDVLRLNMNPIGGT